MTSQKYLSKQKKVNIIYSGIAGIPDPETGIAQPGTGVAEPGDLIFIITHYPYRKLKDEAGKMGFGGTIWPKIKLLLGLDIDDFDGWHVGIYYLGRKRQDHIRINPWIIHSTTKKGVNIQNITPKYFISKDQKLISRVEVLKFVGIKKEKRKKIVDYAITKVGLKFERPRWRHIILSYAFGLPNIFHSQNQFSCQQLAIAAYGAAGIYFPHPCKAFPIFNIGRYIGHPLGHPKERVDPKYPYLMDHHIYRDPRFVLKAAVYQDPTTDEIILQTENLKKYSWNEALREKYIKKGYLDP